MKRYTLAAVAALLVVLPWLGPVRADAPLYTIENLGAYNGMVPSITGINASGQVVGNVSTNGSMAVVYTDGLGWQPLSGLDTKFSIALGINDAGDVVGYHLDGSNRIRAFHYHGGVVDDITPLPGGTMTFAYAINNAGQVVGYSNATNASQVPFITFGTTPTPLPTLGGTGFACGVNVNGQVAGNSNTTSGTQHGMRIDPGVPVPVDVQSTAGAAFAVAACAIDAAGHVAGQMDLASGRTHAFRYTDGAGALDLDTFNSPFSNVESIAAGVSAGWYTLADGFSTHAFAHRDADGSFDLNTRIAAPGWVLATAKGINENGVITGEGTFGGQPAVFRLTPEQASDTTPPVISSVAASPSSIFPPSGQSVPVTITVNATDDSGQAPACSITSITAPGSSPTDASVTGALTGTVLAIGGRTYTFNVKCTDAANNGATSAASVYVVPDTTAPVISSVTATPNNLWPPDNRLVPVKVAVAATDDVDPSPVCALTAVSGVVASDDATITGPLTVTLRAAGGRSYGLGVRCTDAAGNPSTSSVVVVVPADVTAPVISAVSATPNNLWPPDGRLVPVSVSVSATDDVDKQPSCALVSITGFSGPASDAAITGPFSASLRAVGGRTYSLNVRCTDFTGNPSMASVAVVVPADVTAPTITGLSATPASIWPANNKLVPVSIDVSASDDVDASPVCTMTSVTGGPASDIVVTGAFSANVRAARNADGSVRTYVFNVSCRDQAGNTSLAAVTVGVSKDGQSKLYHYNRRLRRFVEGLAHRDERR